MFMVKKKNTKTQTNKNKPQKYRRVLRYKVKVPLRTSLTTPHCHTPQRLAVLTFLCIFSEILYEYMSMRAGLIFINHL